MDGATVTVSMVLFIDTNDAAIEVTVYSVSSLTALPGMTTFLLGAVSLVASAV